MMKIYTFIFGGEVSVRAESEEEAYNIAEDLVAPTGYAWENSVAISVDNIDLVDEREENEDD